MQTLLRRGGEKQQLLFQMILQSFMLQYDSYPLNNFQTLQQTWSLNNGPQKLFYNFAPRHNYF